MFTALNVISTSICVPDGGLSPNFNGVEHTKKKTKKKQVN